MIHFTASIDINRPRDDVFDFIADFEHMPTWNYFVTRVDKLTPGPIDVGTRFHQVRRTDEQDYEITHLEPGRLVEIATTPQSTPALTMRFELRSIDGATRLTDTWDLETAHDHLLEALGSRRIRSAVSQNLGKLTQLLETGVTTLQDGRVATLA